MTAALLKKAVQLPVRDRIKLVQDIWDSIADEQADIKLTSAQKRELDRRRRLYHADQSRASAWLIAKAIIPKRQATRKN